MVPVLATFRFRTGRYLKNLPSPVVSRSCLITPPVLKSRISNRYRSASANPPYPAARVADSQISNLVAPGFLKISCITPK